MRPSIMHDMTNMTNESGFTIAELLVTIAIVSILVALATLSLDFIRRERVTSTTKEVFADFQRARTDAMSQGPSATAPNKRGVGIRFVSSTSYVAFSFNDISPAPAIPAPGAGGNYQYDDATEEADINTRNLSSGRLRVLVGGALTAPPGAPINNIVIFDRFGFPRRTDWQVSAMTIAIDNPVLAGYTKCIIVGANAIREGFWNAATSMCDQQ